MNAARTPSVRVRPIGVALVLTLAGAPAAAQQCATLPPGAIAWYSGERHADDLVGVHNGTALNGTSYVTGQVGEGFHFDNVDDFIGTDTTSAEQRAVRTAFSYELWARPTAVLNPCAQSNNSNCSGNNLRWAIFPLHGEQGAPPEESGLGAGIGLAIGTNGICVGEHAPFLVDCLARLDTPISNSAMTHIAVVVENKTPRIYLNGVLAHTGIASAKQFVLASWEAIGSGFGLGKFEGDLDEVTLYGRALSDVEIADLFAAGANGKCRLMCPTQRIDDAWQSALVTANSALVSNSPDGLFGATNVSPEVDSLLFADNQADGTVHSVEWQTDSPITLTGFGLFAFQDSIATPQRAFRKFRLQAREVGGAFETVYDQPIVVPYAPASRDLRRCVNLRPRRAQQFRAEFTQDGPAGFSGPRVMELDAVALPDRVFQDGFETP